MTVKNIVGWLALVPVIFGIYSVVREPSATGWGTFFTGLVTFLALTPWYGNDQPTSGKADPKQIHDSELLKALQELISPNLRHFFLTHDHSIAVPSERLDSLTDFIFGWTDVDHEFIDPELEKLKADLHQNARRYNHLFSMYTFMDEPGYHTLDTSLRETKHEVWYKRRRELNDAATSIVVAFEELVRVARQKL